MRLLPPCESLTLTPPIRKNEVIMNGNLLNYYDKVLERLENIEEASKEMVFQLMNIEDKQTLIRLSKMTDKELIEYLQNEVNRHYELIDKANAVIDYLRGIDAEARTIALSCDIDHLDKSYEIIKNNPKLTEEEFLDKLLLK